MMKYLGIDYGSKHIGLALSDTKGVVAMPYAVIPNDAKTKKRILEVITSEQIESVVIGESKDFAGNFNTIQQAIDMFSAWLTEATFLPVETTSELFSSKLAKRGTEHPLRVHPRNTDKRGFQKKEKRIDDKAATIMLQSYLDAHSG